MMRTARLLIAALLALGVVGGACGGGGGETVATSAADSSSLEAYFSDLLDLLAESRGDAGDVEARLTDDLDSAETIEDAKRLLGNGVDDFEAVAQTFREGLDSLDPPAAVREQHDAILSTYDDAIDAFAEIKRDLDGVRTQEDLVQLSVDIGGEFGDLTMRTQDACAELRTIAGDNGVTLELEC